MCPCYAVYCFLLLIDDKGLGDDSTCNDHGSGSLAWAPQGLGIRGTNYSDRVDGGETLSMQWNRVIVLN